jgi:hypothetical protein
MGIDSHHITANNQKCPIGFKICVIVIDGSLAGSMIIAVDQLTRSLLGRLKETLQYVLSREI